MLINKAGQNVLFKNNMQNYIAYSRNNTQMDFEEIKRDILQKQSDKQYVKDLQNNKRSTLFFIISSATCAIGALISKNKGEWAIFSVFTALGAILSHFEKPKKENYDKQVEIDLKGEIKNENIANK